MQDRQPRISEIYLGTIALALGVFFLFWSVRGLLAFAAGSKAESANPLIGAVGLLGGTWMLLMSWRLLRGSKHRDQLFSRPALLILSLDALAGSLWALSIGFARALGFLAIAGLGLARWWSLRDAATKNSNS